MDTLWSQAVHLTPRTTSVANGAALQARFLGRPRGSFRGGSPSGCFHFLQKITWTQRDSRQEKATELPRGIVAQPLPANRQFGRREAILHARRYHLRR